MEGIERIKVLGLPIDVVRPEDFEKVIYNLIEQPGIKQIVFLSVWDMLKAQSNAELNHCIESAALVLPISKSIVSAARFLKKTAPIRYYPFRAIVNFFTILENRYRSLFLLGGHPEVLAESEKNIRSTYPGLQIVGRVPGYFQKKSEKDILSAIFKANPSMVLIGDGIAAGSKWVYDRRNSFGSSIFVYFKDAFSIFSQKKKRLKDSTFAAGREIWIEILKNPLKIFLLFPFLWFILLVIGDKLSRR